jgi:hypothetical protein
MGIPYCVVKVRVGVALAVFLLGGVVCVSARSTSACPPTRCFCTPTHPQTHAHTHTHTRTHAIVFLHTDLPPFLFSGLFVVCRARPGLGRWCTRRQRRRSSSPRSARRTRCVNTRFSLPASLPSRALDPHNTHAGLLTLLLLSQLQLCEQRALPVHMNCTHTHTHTHTLYTYLHTHTYTHTPHAGGIQQAARVHQDQLQRPLRRAQPSLGWWYHGCQDSPQGGHVREAEGTRARCPRGRELIGCATLDARSAPVNIICFPRETCCGHRMW